MHLSELLWTTSLEKQIQQASQTPPHVHKKKKGTRCHDSVQKPFTPTSEDGVNEKLDERGGMWNGKEKGERGTIRLQLSSWTGRNWISAATGGGVIDS